MESLVSKIKSAFLMARCTILLYYSEQRLEARNDPHGIHHWSPVHQWLMCIMNMTAVFNDGILGTGRLVINHRSKITTRSWRSLTQRMHIPLICSYVLGLRHESFNGTS